MKGAMCYVTSPDYGDPIVRMQTQIEICKMKSDRRITLEVSGTWLAQMRNITSKGKEGELETVNKRKGGVREGHLHSLHPIVVGPRKHRQETEVTQDDSSGIRGRESYLRKLQDPSLKASGCEILPPMSGYQEA